MNALAPSPLVRACIDCEIEQNILDRRDSTKTHGTCRRHFVLGLLRYDIPQQEINQVLTTMKPADFCPDLKNAD